MPSPEIVAALDGIRRTSLERTVYRHLSPGYEAMSGEGARVQGGRWNPPDSFPVLYMASSVASVLAEFGRMAVRQGRAESDYVTRRLVTYQVSLEGVLDLTQADNLATLGLTGSIITGNDIIPCQAIGEAAHYVGFEGIYAPSAAGTGSIVAVFPTKLGSHSSIEVVREETLAAFFARG